MTVRPDDRLWDWSIALVALSLLLLLLVACVFDVGCAPVPTPAPVDQTAAPTCQAIWMEELGRAIDPPALFDCLAQAKSGKHEPELRQPVHDSPEAIAYRKSLETPPPPPPSAFPFPPEDGHLTIIGKHFFDALGNLWAWRGDSQFLLHARFMRGESIAGQIKWLREYGSNVARVFMRVPWGNEWEFYRTPERDPNYIPSWHAFLDKMAENGLRVELVALTYADANEQQRARTQQAFDIAAPHWNRFVEVANEPHVNGIDPQIALAGVDRHGVLYATGAYSEKQELVTVGDYVTDHTPRVPHWPRLARWIQEDQERYQKPAVGDEPFGAGEQDKDGGGARRTSVKDFAGYFGICMELAAGCTRHSQAGLEGRAPNLEEPIQTAIADAVLKVWQFIPASAQACAYSAPHINTWPLTWTVGDTDTTLEHAYAAMCGDHGWAVVARPRDGYLVTPINGWRVAEVGPFPWMVKVER